MLIEIVKIKSQQFYLLLQINCMWENFGARVKMKKIWKEEDEGHYEGQSWLAFEQMTEGRLSRVGGKLAA